MNLLGDYHTHTVYSHGSGSVMDNAIAAKERGIAEIGISDHGFAHPRFGVDKNKLDALRADCIQAEKQTGVRVLMGLESNFTGSNGECDLTEDLYGKFDVFLLGAHVFVKYNDVKSWFNVSVVNPLFKALSLKTGKAQKNFMTDVYCKAIEKNPVDVITHLNFRVAADVAEVARCCAFYGTYLEINTKKTHMTDAEWEAVLKTDVSFVIGSDAHSPSRVGDTAPALALMDRLSIPKERVHNLDRLPSFRLAGTRRGK